MPHFLSQSTRENATIGFTLLGRKLGNTASTQRQRGREDWGEADNGYHLAPGYLGGKEAWKLPSWSEKGSESGDLSGPAT